MRCGWCGNQDRQTRTNCATCGGTLPSPEDAELGPPPATAPRALPPGFFRRLDYAFDAGGTPRQGTIESTDAEITRFEKGNALQVVYVDGGAASDVWPPIG